MSFPQRCKVCRRVDRMNFSVSDQKWSEVLPKQYADGVVCLTCFDFFASAKGIDYHEDLSDMEFVGEAAHFDFAITMRRAPYKLVT